MKELSIEEKAKAYNEAIKKAESLYNAAEPMSGCNVIIETLFPELKESEDERIRKEIINYFEHYPNIIVKRERKNDYIAWLEKQRPKPQGKSALEAIKEEKADNQNCVKQPTDEEMKTLLRTEYEKERADAIAEMQNPAWSEGDEEMLKMVIKACEQCGNEYAYYWLKSIKDRVQPKQEWSEEDDRMKDSIIKDLIHPWYSKIPDSTEDEINWLKSLRPQNRWKPSEGQLECLGYAIEKAEKDWSPLINNRVYLTLKALKEQLEKLQ